ncbi:MAG: hypothetical protein ACE5OZ_25325 [Candidatus Heimdallarchaeota archaeon]
MIEIITGISSVIIALFGYKEKLSQAKRQRRHDIADYFEEVGKTLAELHAELEARRYPHGKCQEVADLAARMPDALGRDIITNVEELVKLLKKVHEVEQLFQPLDQLNDSERDTQLAIIAGAVGVINALATSVRAGYSGAA